MVKLAGVDYRAIIKKLKKSGFKFIAEILPFKKKAGWNRQIRKVNLPEKGLVDKYIEEERSLS
ncbi:MAG TPA: hypothetical protein PKW98_19835 [Candidatus Wallbacteria bacterium]|nr:MAG: hypothetical protein BWY32_03463 [bacterium ADurb.Bin243]HOD40167.1 hypothetical protein [Candidatus Wallbacteria bacterium]HPG60079.1 hypothetical protein [Candidatus Wallbacteria bacterium]